MSHLLGLGHTSIAMIRTSDAEGAAWSSDIQRVRAWRETLAAAGHPPPDDLLVTVPYGPRAGADAMAQLLARDVQPTAVFAFSDELAAGAYQGALEAGLRVPEDLSIVGVDGHPVAETLGSHHGRPGRRRAGPGDRGPGARPAQRRRAGVIGGRARPAGGPALDWGRPERRGPLGAVLALDVDAAHDRDAADPDGG